MSPDAKDDDEKKVTEFCPKCGNAIEGWPEQRDYRCECGIRWTVEAKRTTKGD